jgi:hypothetical protein
MEADFTGAMLRNAPFPARPSRLPVPRDRAMNRISAKLGHSRKTSCALMDLQTHLNLIADALT